MEEPCGLEKATSLRKALDPCLVAELRAGQSCVVCLEPCLVGNSMNENRVYLGKQQQPDVCCIIPATFK